MTSIAVRREKVVLDLETNFPREAAEAAAAIRLLNEEINHLGKRGGTGSSTRQVSKDLSDVEKQAKRTGSEVDKLSGRMRIFADVAAVLGPGLIPIGAVGIPAITGLASSFGFAALAGGTMIGALQGVGDALTALNKAHLEPTTENINAARLAMSQISPAARDFTRELSALGPQLKSLRDTAATNLFPGLTVGLDALQGALPAVQRIVGAVAGELGTLGAAAGKSLAGPQWASFFKFLADEAPQALAQMGAGVGNVAHAMGQLWMAFEPLNRGFLSWIVEASDKFDTWATHLSGTNGFHDFIAYIQQSGPEVGAALGAIANALIQIVEAAAPLGGPVLHALTAVANAIASMADSDLGTPIFTALAALALYNRGLQVMGKLTKQGAVETAAAGRMSLSTYGAKAKAQLTGYGDALLHVTSAQERASRSVQESGRIQRERFTTLAKGAGQLALLGAATTGVADKFGLANTATLALAGSFLGPWGAAAGAAAGALLDLNAAGAGFNDTLNKLDAVAKGSSIAAISKQLAAAKAQIKDINSTSGVGDFFSDIGKTKGASLLGALPGASITSDKATKSIASANDAANMLSLAAATKAQGAALVAASHGYTLTAVGAREAAGGIAAFAQAATLANNAIGKQSDFDAYKSSLLDAADALKQNGKTLDSNTRAGLANRASLRAVASGALQAAGEMTNFSRRVTFLKGARSNFIALATGMGLSRAAARALANQMGLIPRIVKPKVKVDAGNSAAVIAGVRAGLAAIHDKTVHLTVAQRKVGVGATAGGSISARGNIFYANGDIANGHQPALYPGGPMRVFAEPETGGEAYIPLRDDSRRPRAMDLLDQVAAAFGGTVEYYANGDHNPAKHPKHSAAHHPKHQTRKQKLNAELNEFNKALTKSTDTIDKERSARDDLVSTRNELASGIGGSFLSDPFATSTATTGSSNIWAAGATGSAGGVVDPLGVLEQDTANAKTYQSLIAQLRKNGLSGQALASVDTLDKAQTLMGLGAAGDKQYTSLYNQRAAASSAAGMYTANSVYGAAIAKDNAVLKQSLAEQKKLNLQIKDLEKAIKATPKATGQEVKKGQKSAAAAAAQKKRRGGK